MNNEPTPKIEEYRFADDGVVPNNSRLPLVVPPALDERRAVWALVRTCSVTSEVRCSEPIRASPCGGSPATGAT